LSFFIGFTPKDLQEKTTEVDTESFKGHWRSVGYNRLLAFTEGAYALYTVTDGYCSVFDAGSLEEFHIGYDRLCLHDANHLSLYHAGDLTCYHYLRTDCILHPVDSSGTDCLTPSTVFENFWRVFSENYAFFTLHDTDWDSIHTTFSQLVTPTTSDQALRDIIAQMIAPLRDGHIYITAGEHVIRALSVNCGPRAALQKLFELPAPFISPRASVDNISARIESELLQPFDTTRSPLKRAGNQILSWCELDENIGYINILRLFGFANTSVHIHADDLPHRPLDCAPFLHADMLALNTALDEIMHDCEGMNALIIDARINGGGFDRAGLEIANRFADRKRTAFSKKARQNRGFTEEQTITLTPHAKGTYLKPIYLLVSELTLSAGEIFALCMQAIPHVHLLGEATGGMLSDNLFHKLPNGWEVSLSNEVYLSSQGKSYESIGVEPETALPALGDKLLVDLHKGLIAAVELAKREIT